tara:strand:+ start:4384 stop:5799 length:1416 start_codon:yes stop_codon:yes gene_type:complete
MFKLEKVFQNNDSAFIYFVNFFKTTIIFFSVYNFSILENNSLFDLLNIDIFIQSKYFNFSIHLSLIFYIFTLLLKKSKDYNHNFISFLREDILNFLISIFFIFSIYFILNTNFNLNLNIIYLIFFILLNLFFFKQLCNYLYNLLIDKNIIQKNIMLIGKYNDVQKILKENFNKIYVFKCCLILDVKDHNEKFLKSEIKIPVFSVSDDIRSILEYHALGQVWILGNKKYDIDESLSKIIQFSVDLLIVNLNVQQSLISKKLLVNKYDYEYYEISKFYGGSLLLKILLDKILSIIFLILASPILIISMIIIYFEDGFPLVFTQNRTGWDGRRFKIYKLRTLKKEKFDKTVQVQDGDKRVLNFGKLIRKYSIDELPQFINVLIGDMSIVGPRPHMVEHDIKYAKLFNKFLKRHKCNPGITGWAQVNGLRGATPSPEIMKKRMESDLWYLNNWSIWLDLYIILKTFYALIKYKGE